MNKSLFRKLVSVYIVMLLALAFLAQGIIGMAVDKSTMEVNESGFKPDSPSIQNETVLTFKNDPDAVGYKVVVLDATGGANNWYPTFSIKPSIATTRSKIVNGIDLTALYPTGTSVAYYDLNDILYFCAKDIGKNEFNYDIYIFGYYLDGYNPYRSQAYLDAEEAMGISTPLPTRIASFAKKAGTINYKCDYTQTGVLTPSFKIDNPTQTVVTWNAAAGANGYDLYICTAPNADDEYTFPEVLSETKNTGFLTMVSETGTSHDFSSELAKLAEASLYSSVKWRPYIRATYGTYGTTDYYQSDWVEGSEFTYTKTGLLTLGEPQSASLSATGAKLSWSYDSSSYSLPEYGTTTELTLTITGVTGDITPTYFNGTGTSFDLSNTIAKIAKENDLTPVTGTAHLKAVNSNPIFTASAVTDVPLSFSDPLSLMSTETISTSDGVFNWTFDSSDDVPTAFTSNATTTRLGARDTYAIAKNCNIIIPSTAILNKVVFSKQSTFTTPPKLNIKFDTSKSGYATDKTLYVYSLGADNKTLTQIGTYKDQSADTITMPNMYPILVSDVVLPASSAADDKLSYTKDGIVLPIKTLTTVGTDALSLANSASAPLIVKNSNYQWSFASIPASASAFTPTLAYKPTADAEVKTAVTSTAFPTDSKYLQVDCGSGTLPASATLTAYVSIDDVASGSTVYMYYYNSTSKKLEYVSSTTYTSGAFAFVLSKTGTYVMTTKKATSSSGDDSGGSGSSSGDSGSDSDSTKPYTRDDTKSILTMKCDGKVDPVIFTDAKALGSGGYKVIIISSDEQFIWEFPKGSDAVKDFDPNGTITEVNAKTLAGTYTSNYFSADTSIYDIKFKYSGSVPSGTLLKIAMVNTTNFPTLETKPPYGYYVDSTNKKLELLNFYQNNIGITITDVAELYLSSKSLTNMATGSYYYSSDGKTLNMACSQDDKTGTEIWEVAMKNGLNVELRSGAGVGGSLTETTGIWTFKAEDIKKAVDFCPYFKRGTKTSNGFEEAVKAWGFPAGTVYMGLLFSHTGELPGKCTVKYVFNGSESWTEGQTLYHYYYDPDKKVLDLYETPTYTNKSCTVTITHCCEYLLSSTKTSNDKTSAGSSSTSSTKSADTAKSPKTDGLIGDTFRNSTDVIATFFRRIKEWLIAISS